jgi:carboxypeptidase Taq
MMEEKGINMNAYKEILQMYDEVSVIGEISSQLTWDQHTYMPKKAAAMRGGQGAFLSTLSHRKITDPRIGILLDKLEGQELDEEKNAVVREIRRTYTRKTAVPEELEAEIAKLEPISMQSWIEAKSRGDFKLFASDLEKMLDLKMQVAEKVGYSDTPYDAMLEDHEPYTLTRQVKEVFERLRKKMVPIVEKIVYAEKDEIVIKGDFPKDSQESFYRKILIDMGYDFDGGRLDETEHPFTIGSGDDTRITTHYHEKDPSPALFSCIHEGGHALYEQGFLEEHYHTPLGEACSLGIHESQSRMWENLIGRSYHFWKHYYSGFQEALPTFSNVPLPVFYEAINQVKPSLIRTQADEVTYNLHILIRFEIEIDIFEGRIDINEIPQAWNDKYENYLGIRPDNDSVGCLQDIHWSMGAFGYFPTYALGNLYGSQFFDHMKQDLDVDGLMENGDLRPILSWLRTNIHHRGKLYPASELVKVVTGNRLDEDHFINYLKAKFGPIYEISL